MRPEDEAEFHQYVTDRSHALRRTAYLMCGDWHQAEDVVQTALVKVYRAWRRVGHHGNRDAYVRQVMVRVVIDDQRRPWRRERSFAAMPDDLAAAEDGIGVEERDELLEAMALIPPRQRATLVLRFWEDQSIEQAAHTLGCSEGTVKSQTARGLVTLRQILQDLRIQSARRLDEGCER